MPIQTRTYDPTPGQLYQTPFISAPERVIQDEMDLAAFAGTELVDEYGALKPGAPLAHTGESFVPFGAASSSYDVTAADPDAGTLTLGGDQTGALEAGDQIEVSGSTANDGTYTVSAAEYDDQADATTVSVEEDLGDATADGTVSQGDAAAAESIYAVTAYPQRVAEGNTAADLTGAGQNPEITAATGGLINGQEIEAQLGRELTAAERTAFDDSDAFTVTR